MKVRIYPRVRHTISDFFQVKDDSKWTEVSLKNLKEYFQYWWPITNPKIVKDHIEVEQIDDWFRERYLGAIDHTIKIDGKWRNGVDKDCGIVRFD